MKNIFLFTLSLTVFQFGFAQENTIKLKSGELDLIFDKQLERASNIKYYFMSFSAIPTIEKRNKIANLGVKFLEYIPSKTYVVKLGEKCELTTLANYGVTSILPIEGKHKLDPKIQNNIFPEWAINDGKLSIKVLIYNDVNISTTNKMFKMNGYKIDETNSSSNSIKITINSSELSNIANMSSVWYIEPIDAPSKKENKTGRTLHRSNSINTMYSSGRHYNGEGINIMMQDDGIIGPHIDYNGRIDQSNCVGCSTNSSNDHGDHVAGTIMGSGNLDPIAVGMSNAAFLYVYGSSNNNYYDVPAIYQNNDVVITSKSYSNGCNSGYTSLAKDLDEQINLLPSLIHIFSAGNDGGSDCGYGAGIGWGNVTGGHKQGKNVIAVANLTSSSTLASSSSRGPAADGRIKPDIGAKGSSVNSTIPENDYGYKTGTSMSCPGIAGVMGQLYQAFKELNGGQNPNSSIMKNILLNGADDIGNPGPDFKHGWGEVNALRSVSIIEDNQYIIDNISQGTNNTHTLTIPSGTKQLKLMVYWHDKEGSANAIPSLVNDLDIELFDNSGNSVELPWILDATATSAALNAIAIKGVDHINNMEQITIDNPSTGIYSLMVNGNSIPFGPQEYSVSYVFIMDEITVTYPLGGEGWVPSESEVIRWDAYGESGSFTLEYTIDAGASWTTISSSISGGSRQYTLNSVPNINTSNAKIRISRNGVSDESDSYFTIISVPQNITVSWICPDSIYVYWSQVIGATSYEVSMLGNMYMDSMTTTNALMALIINPNPSNADSWFSVRANINGGKGRRAISINAQSINNSCLGPPLAAFSLLDPVSCSGILSFIDESMYQPNYWQWNFGDGNMSNLQNPTHNFENEGVYNVSLFVSNSLGIDSILQTSIATVDFLPAPLTLNDTSYSSPAIFSLNSITGDNINWYTDTLGSPPISSGLTFVTPSLSSNTTFYAREFGGPSIFGGALDSAIGDGSFYSGNRYLILDAFAECKLISAAIYANAISTITFELRDNNGNILDDTTLTVSIGQQTVYFGFDIPIGTELQLGVNGNVSGLYRNNNGASFPYPIGTLISINGASNTSTQNNWYFFYNIEIQENCISNFAEATAVFITPQSFSEESQTLNLFPNPTSSKCNIISSEDIKKIEVFDVSGRSCIKKYNNSKSTALDVSILSKGLYIIELMTKSKVFTTQLIIK